SASASTIFTIDKSGRMYTRMFDFEMYGACPGLHYTFEKIKQTDDPEQILTLFNAVRVLPLDEWKPQPAIVVSGQGAITTNISIHLTGKGNAARELRVQGKDSDGSYGYYYKPIFAADSRDWSFHETGETYDPDVEIARDAPHVLGRKLDKTYTGKLSQLLTPDLDVQLVDFNYYDTPAILRVTGFGATIDLKLFTFEAWSPTTQMKDAPELVGSVYGEPKELLGTLEIPEQYLQSKDKKVKTLVHAYFQKYNHVHQAFSISADDRTVKIHTRMIQKESTGYFDYSLKRPLDMTLTRELTPEDEAVAVQGGFMALANAPALILTDLPAHPSGKDYQKIVDATGRNEAVLKEIKRINRERKIAHLKSGLLSSLAVAVFYPVNTFISLIDLPEHSLLWGNLNLGGGIVFSKYAGMNMKLVFSSTADYKRAVKVLEDRVNGYKAITDAMKAGG
ncbi:MAG TPA: hypothetical protein VL588_09835, partial [Bdellovibrionota bacterium]|nr:hypothetical protein [Bdellovibrionota bacterium]